MDFLPRDASGLHGWLRALFSQLGPIDKSADSVLFKAVAFYIYIMDTDELNVLSTSVRAG